jgi:hypothetical protein
MSKLEAFIGWLHGGRSRQQPTLGITRGLLRDLDEMPPGQSITIVHASGSRFTVMHEDDFDHIVRLAGLKSVPVPTVKDE